ncbi:ImmA/IrrE family metallo-endopeptidase [Paludicola sp. MB14-C6]|uniref:ImmA/IrrE family metallo-endopeptidase n=1 Tax=Paludihabitans sp. MB14-C6 TaxID=3070656 RepID=UPI0027DD0E72|nr:ImmA/IrrE family metallo-endopeptidase [Paludicola sp. MB14-C6]WMJ22925.1 ImmA/IrrE family metallo-endopeptidase [Paludicola sp. MB14-C6]
MQHGIKSFREQALETIARNIIKEYDPTLLGSDPRAIPIEEIIEQHLNLTIEYQYIRKNGRILGETVFDDDLIPIYDKEDGKGYTFVWMDKGTIVIDASLLECKNDGRLRFTLAHELAHWLIHNEYYCNLGEVATMKTDIRRSSDTDKYIERQADILAGHLLMPKGQVKMAFNRLRGKSANIISDLAERFDVSKQAMEIKLNSCNLL